ncbi:hypothetical protein Cob_v007699 [Colletotrichum orbiculare MAFF 240422]|uniref:Uncharacterized protein n=1 Tax=Colletotrichum orbiculare (strain 104-T / ATCC 96160 / CBS 514.97 / LARS 414 / MAFF 240422) TaxID=1213857 RepID=A0A484FPE9_COLOR|nr:hypothetical protein Cob_v007699 [Colletotrichum orbiculare MAFF 240422]
MRNDNHRRQTVGDQSALPSALFRSVTVTAVVFVATNRQHPFPHLWAPVCTCLLGFSYGLYLSFATRDDVSCRVSLPTSSPRERRPLSSSRRPPPDDALVCNSLSTTSINHFSAAARLSAHVPFVNPPALSARI